MKAGVGEPDPDIFNISFGNSKLEQAKRKVYQITLAKNLDKRIGFVPVRPDLVVLGYHQFNFGGPVWQVSGLQVFRCGGGNEGGM